MAPRRGATPEKEIRLVHVSRQSTMMASVGMKLEKPPGRRDLAGGLAGNLACLAHPPPTHLLLPNSPNLRALFVVYLV